MKIDPAHVEIPKEELDKIIAEFGCDSDAAVRAFIEAKQSSDDAYQNTLQNVLGAVVGIDSPSLNAFSPNDIKEHLDRFVIGQEDYKKRLSVAAAYHFAMVKALSSGSAKMVNVKRFRKKNTIISGPSGSGKTYCVEILGDLLEIPTLVIDATDYTESGYVGKSADDMIRELIQLAPGGSKAEKAQFVETNGGLIFVDEMDKKAKDGKVIGHDISREGFQRAVLKLIERKHIAVDDPNSPAGQIQDLMDQQRGIGPGTGQGKRKATISTENILFILGGSFQRSDEDLESIVKRRLEKGSGHLKEDGSITITGFVTSGIQPIDPSTNYFKNAEAEDYIKFGIIPELVGRAPVRTYVNALSKNDLRRIMTETEDSIIEQYRFEFSLFDIDISFSSDALDWIAKKAENKKTGARALISVFENVLTEFQFTLPGGNIREIQITREICEAPQDQLLAMLELSPIFDFVEKFRRDHGIDLLISDEVEQRIRQFAADNNIPLSTAITRLLSKASALNYMNKQGKFEITWEMLENPKYFDDLYVEWHKSQADKSAE
ncbi:MAG TPA: AAA family ATPase [Nitrospinota bacterium]|nr:AAA family ATPase [Nitrospinota bacterium]|tara:strand:+ start:251491 stop:253134 length:1644 start_codon:yes stop_codon:yes gene_type:complete